MKYWYTLILVYNYLDATKFKIFICQTIIKIAGRSLSQTLFFKYLISPSILVVLKIFV